MKLHTINGSPYGRKVHAVLNHLKLDYEIEWLDIFNGDLQTEAFETLNPNKLVPVLIDGDTKMWESNAILYYLATEKAPDTTLFPVKLRSDIMRWLFWGNIYYNKSFGTIAFETMFKPLLNLGDTDQTVVDAAVIDFEKFAVVLDKHLENREFMVGNDWTLADYSIGALEGFASSIPVDFDKYPNITRLYNKLRQNENWTITAPASPAEIGKIPTNFAKSA